MLFLPSARGLDHRAVFLDDISSELGEASLVERTGADHKIISRRSFLKTSALAAAQLAIPAVAMAGIHVATRRRLLSFHNLHTLENLTTTYWVDGEYVAEELARVNYILRDFRANEIKPIDLKLLDLLVALRQKLGTSQPFQIISGYRSPKTNAILHANSEGVAVHSLHIEGRAIDICVEGRSLDTLRAAALSLGRGGVGYYPKTGFVHVDTGRVRWWGGAPPARPKLLQTENRHFVATAISRSAF